MTTVHRRALSLFIALTSSLAAPTHARSAVIQSGLRLADEYSADLVDVYGLPAKDASECMAIINLRGEFDQGCAFCACEYWGSHG